MEAQLDFTWQPEPVVWNPAPAKHSKEERYELPQQLGFQLADLPSIPTEQPVPMAFTNGGPKLIQYRGQQKPKKKSQSISKPKPVFSNKPKVIQKTPNKPKAKPEWNSQVSNIGLFDPVISKKLPIEIQHAMKKESGLPKKPQFYQDLHSVPEKKNQVKANKSEKNVRVQENLDIKFIADQEDIVKNLERELERERIARKKLDDQFALKMKEMEKINKKINTYEKSAVKTETEKRINIQNPPEIPKQTQPSIAKNNFKSSSPGLIPKPQNYPIFNSNKGNIYEEPTHDIGPAVLKAPKTNQGVSFQIQKDLKSNQGVTAQIPKPQKISQGVMAQIQELPQKVSNYAQSNNKATNDSFAEINEKVLQKNSYTGNILEPRPKTQPVQFQSFDIAESDPVLNSISAALVRYKAANEYNTKASSVLISQVGAKYIAYYANELTDMLIDDFLEDTVYDLQRIEEKKHRIAHDDFTKEAETHFQTIIKDFEQETRAMQAKHLTVHKVSKEDEVLKRIMQDDDTEEIFIEDPRREWNVELGDEEIARVRRYKKEFEEFQRVFSGGSDGKLWDVYAVIGDDIVEELFREVAKEYDDTLDEFTERFMNNEFA